MALITEAVGRLEQNLKALTPRLEPRTAGRKVACKLHTALPKIIPFADDSRYAAHFEREVSRYTADFEDSRYVVHFDRQSFALRCSLCTRKFCATLLISLADDSRCAVHGLFAPSSAPLYLITDGPMLPGGNAASALDVGPSDTEQFKVGFDREWQGEESNPVDHSLAIHSEHQPRSI